MADFETIEVDHKDCEASFHKSDYAQVIFNNIAEVYMTNIDIECGYTITSSLTPNNRDWIGLYKVGWRSSKEYHNFTWAPLPSGYQPQTDARNVVTFRASDLPHDDGEFYQFCYVASSGHVRGASTPFLFKSTCDEEYVEVEAEDGELLVVKTRTALLQEKLDVASEEREKLEKERLFLEAERDSLVNKLMELEKQLSAEQTDHQLTSANLKASEDVVASLNTEARDMQLVHDGLHDKISVLNQEKQSMEKRLDDNDVYIRDLQEKIKMLINEKDALTGRNKTLEEEKELFKNHFTSSESTIQCYLKETQRLKSNLESVERDTAQLRGSYEEEIKKGESRMKVISDNKEQISQLEEHIGLLEERAHNAENKLEAAEHCKVLLNEEVSNLQLVYDKVSADLERAKTEEFLVKSSLQQQEDTYKQEVTKEQSEKTRLQQMLLDKQMELDEVKGTVKNLQASLRAAQEERRTEEEGPLYALRTVQDNLKQRLAKAKKANDDLRKQLKDSVPKQMDQEERVRSLKREVSELSERLIMGQEEYQKQFVQTRKLENQLRKLQKQDSRSDSVRMTESELQTTAVESDTSEKESQTDAISDEEPADLTAAELVQQLEDLGLELEKRSRKQLKYKQLYHDEKERNSFLRRHYSEELGKKDEDLTRMQSLVKAPPHHPRDVHPKTSPPPTSPNAVAVNPPKSIYPNPYVDYTCQDDPAQMPSPKPLTEEVKVFDPLLAGSDSGDITAPLQPLPPPICPVQTQTAKMAAIRAIHRNESQSSQQNRADGPDPSINMINNIVAKGASPSTSEDLSAGPVQPSAPIETRIDMEEGEVFEDAIEAPLRTCPICSMTFPLDTSNTVFAYHIEDHYSKVCPICQKCFDKKMDDMEFQKHVESHLDSFELP